jgi:polyisoprenoid-binding protein YceI
MKRNHKIAIPKLDEHLKGKDFFDVAQFPTATFVSDKITKTGNNAKVQGMLTIHGVSKPVTLNVKLNKVGVNPMSKKKAAGFSATATIKRSDFGVGKYVPDVGDEVTLDIQAEAIKAD